MDLYPELLTQLYLDLVQIRFRNPEEASPEIGSIKDLTKNTHTSNNKLRTWGSSWLQL